jgi:hypothetical protein
MRSYAPARAHGDRVLLLRTDAFGFIKETITPVLTLYCLEIGAYRQEARPPAIAQVPRGTKRPGEAYSKHGVATLASDRRLQPESPV